jgi:dUTP pyrophosphatase
LKFFIEAKGYDVVHEHKEDAGYDIRTPHDVMIYGHDSAIVETGVHVQIPNGYVGMLKSKSGLNVKNSITGEGVIDSGYTGEIVVKLYNNSNFIKTFNAGDKIIQLVVLPVLTEDVEYCGSLDELIRSSTGSRGNSGFGSTGR